jgi:hypothetical protein
MHNAVGEILFQDIARDFVVFIYLYWLLKFKNIPKKCAMIKYKTFPIKALELQHVSAHNKMSKHDAVPVYKK